MLGLRVEGRCQQALHSNSNSSTSFLAGVARATTSRQDGGSKPNAHQSVSNLPGLTQARGDSSSFQMMKKHGGDKRVPSVDHGEAICPTSPMSRTTDTRGLSEKKPTECTQQRGGILNGPGNTLINLFSECSPKHCHTARSFPAAEARTTLNK